MQIDDRPWKRVDVSDWPVKQVEAGGSNPVLWLTEPITEVLWLHKNIHIPQNGVPQGEDWAEVLATQVGGLLGVPCAETRLCRRNGVRGSLSKNMVPAGSDLNEGGVVLEAARVPGYFRQADSKKVRDPDRPNVERPGHTLANIRTVLSAVEPPETFGGPAGFDGFDVFAGFMILDALVANRDRHEQNWAVLTPRLTNQRERLAPAFDHGGSLGYQLTDEDRRRRLVEDARMTRWASNGTAHRFEHDGRNAPTLVEHAAAAVEMCSGQAAEWWRERLLRLDLRPLHGALTGGISGMSEAAARFASRLLDLNLRRLRDAICSGS